MMSDSSDAMNEAESTPPSRTEERGGWKIDRWSLFPALAAGLCWAGAIALLLLIDLRTEPGWFAPQRLLFYALALGAGLLTFTPVELHMQLPGLAFEGVAGTALLLYTLAFTPPPTGWLLDPPDLPVYALLAIALFWSVAAIMLPFVYALSQRLFKQRARRSDLRRARRQAYEFGVLAACIVVLAGLRVLTWVSILLVILILITAELLFLARVKTEST